MARTGSLNGAARQAGVSQQAISARIRAMEAQTGVALVHRTPRGSALTADGAVIAEWAARLLDVAAGLDAGIAALRQDRRARLRVSASSTIAEQLLPGWLASFRAAAPPDRPPPDIVLTAANTEQVIGHVAAGSAGIGFIEGPPRPAGPCSKVIGQDRLVVVVAPAHRWARRRALSAAELVGTPLVSWEGGSGTRDTLSAALTAALGAGAAQVPAALSVSTTAAVRAAVLAAAAPAVISEHDPGKRRLAGALGSPPRPIAGLWFDSDGAGELQRCEVDEVAGLVYLGACLPAGCDLAVHDDVPGLPVECAGQRGVKAA